MSKKAAQVYDRTLIHYKLEVKKFSAADIFVVNVVVACWLLALGEAIKQVFHMIPQPDDQDLVVQFQLSDSLVSANLLIIEAV